MMTKPAAFFATYSDWRLIRGRKVVQVVFEVPIEASGLVHDVLGGMPNPASEVWCAIARLKQQPKENEAQPRPSTLPTDEATTGGAHTKRSWNVMSPAQQAGLLCNEPAFWKFLSETFQDVPVENNLEAAAFVRNFCDVESRSHIKLGHPSGKTWAGLVSAYRGWMKEPAVVG